MGGAWRGWRTTTGRERREEYSTWKRRSSPFRIEVGGEEREAEADRAERE